MAKARPTRNRACAVCGLKRLRNGDDPCIPDLPGVQFACCGHGEGPGYIMFYNGLVIRGYFRRDGLKYLDGYYTPSSNAEYDHNALGWREPGQSELCHINCFEPGYKRPAFKAQKEIE
jgi:hypothetical protein